MGSSRHASAVLSSLILLTLPIAGCGDRQLQAVTLTPATADAKNSPSGQVTFTATGKYSTPPSPVQLTGQQVFWCSGGIGTSSAGTGECVGNANAGVTVNENGVARCNQNFVGTATVLAGTLPSPPPPVPSDSGPTLKIYGSAQLTCP